MPLCTSSKSHYTPLIPPLYHPYTTPYTTLITPYTILFFFVSLHEVFSAALSPTNQVTYSPHLPSLLPSISPHISTLLPPSISVSYLPPSTIHRHNLTWHMCLANMPVKRRQFFPFSNCDLPARSLSPTLTLSASLSHSLALPFSFVFSVIFLYLLTEF